LSRHELMSSGAWRPPMSAGPSRKYVGVSSTLGAKRQTGEIGARGHATVWYTASPATGATEYHERQSQREHGGFDVMARGRRPIDGAAATAGSGIAAAGRAAARATVGRRPSRATSSASAG